MPLHYKDKPWPCDVAGASNNEQIVEHESRLSEICTGNDEIVIAREVKSIGEVFVASKLKEVIKQWL